MSGTNTDAPSAVRQLMETISCGLEGNEYFTLLSWTQNTYPGPELLGHPSLAISTQALPPLLEKQTVDTLIREYVEVRRDAGALPGTPGRVSYRHFSLPRWVQFNVTYEHFCFSFYAHTSSQTRLHDSIRLSGPFSVTVGAYQTLCVHTSSRVLHNTL